jgi:hypothetical protein
MMPVVDEPVSVVPLPAPPAPVVMLLVPPAPPAGWNREVFSSPPQPFTAHANAKTHQPNDLVLMCIVLFGKERSCPFKESFGQRNSRNHTIRGFCR